MNIWLLVFVSEFLIANRRGREVRSGFWLGGLLLKPQTLILLLLGLLIARRFKIGHVTIQLEPTGHGENCDRAVAGAV